MNDVFPTPAEVVWLQSGALWAFQKDRRGALTRRRLSAPAAVIGRGAVPKLWEGVREAIIRFYGQERNFIYLFDPVSCLRNTV